MLPKQQRLTVAAFARHFAIGRRNHGTYVQVIHSPADTFQASAVVGKKVFKRAVDRNQMRRQMYEVLRDWQREAKTSGVYICIAKPAAKNASFQVLATDLKEQLARSSASR